MRSREAGPKEHERHFIVIHYFVNCAIEPALRTSSAEREGSAPLSRVHFRAILSSENNRAKFPNFHSTAGMFPIPFVSITTSGERFRRWGGRGWTTSYSLSQMTSLDVLLVPSGAA
jgi:hypothetical protein